MTTALIALVAGAVGWVWGAISVFAYEDWQINRARRTALAAVSLPKVPKTRDADRVRVRVRIPLGRPIL